VLGTITGVMPECIATANDALGGHAQSVIASPAAMRNHDGG